MRLVPLFTEGRTDIPLHDEPTRVWGWSLAERPGLEVDIRFMANMDRGHDWSWRGGMLRYSPSDRSPAWIVLQFGVSEPIPCLTCSTPSDRLVARFCLQCGAQLRLELSVSDGKPRRVRSDDPW